MKISKLMLGALLAIGSAVGAGVQAQSINYSMYICCSQLQNDCNWSYGEDHPRCVGLYESCMLSRRCIIP